MRTFSQEVVDTIMTRTYGDVGKLFKTTQPADRLVNGFDILKKITTGNARLAEAIRRRTQIRSILELLLRDILAAVIIALLAMASLVAWNWV
ncbi:hypothetical protein MMC13_005907 [Lambiella insularis]|nr:hypothetical protein [Lambiella insularis]